MIKGLLRTWLGIKEDNISNLETKFSLTKQLNAIEKKISSLQSKLDTINHKLNK